MFIGAGTMTTGNAKTTGDVADQVRQIFDRTKHELSALLLSVQAPVESNASSSAQLEWMTARQLAEYWQIYSEEGEPRTAGILKWARRPPDQFPLPHGYMGDLIRFKRGDVDRWAIEEASRRRVGTQRKRLRENNQVRFKKGT